MLLSALNVANGCPWIRLSVRKSVEKRVREKRGKAGKSGSVCKQLTKMLKGTVTSCEGISHCPSLRQSVASCLAPHSKALAQRLRISRFLSKGRDSDDVERLHLRQGLVWRLIGHGDAKRFGVRNDEGSSAFAGAVTPRIVSRGKRGSVEWH